MKKRLKLSLLLSVYIFIISGIAVYAHSGRTDSNGGHWDRSTGTYHYHTGEYAGRSHTTYAPTPSPAPTKESNHGAVATGIIITFIVSFAYALMQELRHEPTDKKTDIVELDQRHRDKVTAIIKKISEHEKYLSINPIEKDRDKYLYTLNEYNKLIEQIPNLIQEIAINCAVYDACIDRVHFNKNKLRSLKACRENQEKAKQSLHEIHQTLLQNNKTFQKRAFPKRVLLIKHMCSKCGEILQVRYHAAEGQAKIPKMSITCPYCDSDEIITPEENI